MTTIKFDGKTYRPFERIEAIDHLKRPVNIEDNTYILIGLSDRGVLLGPRWWSYEDLLLKGFFPGGDRCGVMLVEAKKRVTPTKEILEAHGKPMPCWVRDSGGVKWHQSFLIAIKPFGTKRFICCGAAYEYFDLCEVEVDA